MAPTHVERAQRASSAFARDRASRLFDSVRWDAEAVPPDKTWGSCILARSLFYSQQRMYNGNCELFFWRYWRLRRKWSRFSEFVDLWARIIIWRIFGDENCSSRSLKKNNGNSEPLYHDLRKVCKILSSDSWQCRKLIYFLHLYDVKYSYGS